MTDDAPRCTHVRDHLLAIDIPVRCIEPGTETSYDRLSSLEALALSVDVAEAELHAIDEYKLVDDYGADKDAHERLENATDALKLEALAAAKNQWARI